MGKATGPPLPVRGARSIDSGAMTETWGPVGGSASSHPGGDAADASAGADARSRALARDAHPYASTDLDSPRPPGAGPSVGPAAAPVGTRAAAWADIAPDNLRKNALLREQRGAFGAYDDPVDRRAAMFQILLGVFLGLALTLLCYTRWGAALGPFTMAPAVAIGLPTVFARRNEVRHLGFGALISVLVASVMVMLYALFIYTL